MALQQQIKKRNASDLLNLAIIGVLLLLYAPILLHWLDGWLNKNISTEHEYFSHGIIGLPFAAYLAWMNRKKWTRLPDTIHPLSAVLLLLGQCFILVVLQSGLTFPCPLSWQDYVCGLKE